ncbi:MAG TPA: erythromycin esterase family protein [Thermoanaerobaculia bacterium]|nr:erythromycin esterase family protein [Thermoanaerobaculia bacterium]
MRRWFWTLSACLLLVSPLRAQQVPFLDLDFEMPECLGGWQVSTGSRFDIGLDMAETVSGAQSARLRYVSPLPWSVQVAGVGMQRQLSPAVVAGKRVQLSGYIRTEAVDERGYASIYLAAFTPSSFVYDDTYYVGARGTTPWTRYEIAIDVPADATRFLFGVQVFGNGTSWFDNLQMTVDGQALDQSRMPRMSPPPPGHANWLSQRVLPFTTPLAGSGFADLQGLKPVIGDARIVSLGEATHGTREFFQMKHRLLEFLAEEMGFTHFAIEASMPDAYKINDYVLTGQGDPAELVAGMLFWTWNTQEVLDMVLWMRQYNAANASNRAPLQFTGFDMQDPTTAVANLRAFLSQADPGYLPQAQPIFVRMQQLEATRRPTAADLAAIRGVLDHLTAARGGYLAAGLPAERVDWMIQNARILVQFVESPLGIASRDQSMAANVDWILDHAPAGSKIVLWAHNGHVNKNAGYMGDYLAQRHGDDMYVLGFAFGGGRYNAVGPQGLRDHEAGVLAPDGVEALLAATGIPRFIVDLRSLGADNGVGGGQGDPSRWFHEQRFLRMHGAAASRCALRPVVAADYYDGLIWFEQTSPSVLLPVD